MHTYKHVNKASKCTQHKISIDHELIRAQILVWHEDFSRIVVVVLEVLTAVNAEPTPNSPPAMHAECSTTRE